MQSPTSVPLPDASPVPARLAGRRALITGSSRGIGRAIAERLAQDGAAVFLSARVEEDLMDAVRAVSSFGGRTAALACDITSEGAVQRLTDAAVSELGGIDILVNNVGGAHRIQPLDQLSEHTFALGTELNYSTVYRMMHAAAPHLLAAAPRSCVLNVVSIAAERGLHGMSYYSGAKAAVVAMSRTAAREWGPLGVRVNCLGPGWIATDLSRPLREDKVFAEKTLVDIPLQRWGTAEEVADAAAFLVSDAARYITGVTLYVDGGILA